MGCKGAQAGRKGGGEIEGRHPDEEAELGAMRAGEAGGMRGGAEKCMEIAQNPDCEGGVPCHH